MTLSDTFAATTADVSPTRSGLPFHRLPRADPRHRWWRPLLVGLVAAGLCLALFIALVVVTVVAGLVDPAVEVAVDRFSASELDVAQPLPYAVLLASLIILLPAVAVATRVVGSRPVGLLWSVTGRLRWGWLRSATLLALALWVPVMVLWVLVDLATGTFELRAMAPSTSLILLGLTLLLVPFQAAAEEVVFRGYLMQLVGSWLRHPAFAVLLPVPIFVVGHGYGFYGSVDVGAFAVMCGWLAWRTGGLEAPIAAHVVNNVVLMSMAAFGIGDPNATDTSAAGLAVSLTTMIIFTVLVTRRADRLGLARTRARAEVVLDPES